MHSLGIVRVNNLFRWALMKNGAVVVRMEESAEVPADVLSIKDLIIVTGLEGEAVLRRDLSVPLTSKRLVEKSLPFQLEPLLPFPLNQTVVYAQYYPKEKSTGVTAWATTKEFLESHLAEWKELDPDMVSYASLALARWARFNFPQMATLTTVSGSIAIAIDQSQIVCAMSSPESSRLEFFLKQKYPLFVKVEAHPFAIPIGLALEPFEKRPCQLRSGENLSMKQKSKAKTLLRAVFVGGVGLILLTWGLSSAIFYAREKKLFSNGRTVSALRRQVIQETKTAPKIPNVPSVQDFLSWISTLKTSVDVQHIAYELASPIEVCVTLDFRAPDEAAARDFVKQLQQTPSFVEPTYELKWTSEPPIYTLSFPLQKKE